jgi:class 3 adenylate cyclase
MGTTDIRISSRHLVGEIPEGERKAVTAMFADIKGQMELMEDLDPEEARTIVDPALNLMIDAVPATGYSRCSEPLLPTKAIPSAL